MGLSLSPAWRERWYLVFLASLTAVPPLATDMYLGAIPAIAEQWQVSQSRIGLSLVLWFVTFSLGLLVCGPLSDRFGRKPVLLGGVGLFALGSFLCALSATPAQLILFRILQGAGAAAPSSMSMAICRDRYEGHIRKRILAWIAILLSVVPMLAPIAGSLLLKVTGWPSIFVVQGVLVLFSFGGTLLYQETLETPLFGGLAAMFRPYLRIARNLRFLLAVFALQIVAGPFFGYIAFSAIVYIVHFHLTPDQFSLFFGVNAFISMLGAFVCTRLDGKIRDVRLLTLCISGAALAGYGLFLTGHLSPLTFALFMGGYTFCYGMSRPLSNHIILEQVKRDIGSASSLLVFVQYLTGALCMRLATIPWEEPIRAFGLLALGLPGTVLLLWPLILKKVAFSD